MDREERRAAERAKYPEFHAHFEQTLDQRDPQVFGYSMPGNHIFGDGFYVAVDIDRADLDDKERWPESLDGLPISYQHVGRPTAY